MMKVTAVIVTYANRFYLLEQVIQACLKAKVDAIIIVDNNSAAESKNQLCHLVENDARIHVIWNAENLGSAKAYQQGMQKAKTLENPFIWLLDDDNLPMPNTLATLKSAWKEKDEETAALLAYRPDRTQYKKAVELTDSSFVLSPPNSFSGFDAVDKIKRIFKPSKLKENPARTGTIDYAPYGGLFFKTQLLETIGYPDEKLYLYSDDHEWSYRITTNQQKIVLVLDAILNDIEASWGVKKRGNSFYNLKNATSFRMYYSIRNRMWFENQYRITKPWLYHFNYALFSLIMFVYCRRHPNYKVFKKAVYDARNHNFGKVL